MKNSGNKTCNITRKQLLNRKLRMNAKEIWTLLEVFPLILNQLVSNPMRCKVYKYTLKMVDLLNALTKKSFTENNINELGDIIDDHHKTYISVFSKRGNIKKLTPKFHL